MTVHLCRYVRPGNTGYKYDYADDKFGRPAPPPVVSMPSQVSMDNLGNGTVHPNTYPQAPRYALYDIWLYGYSMVLMLMYTCVSKIELSVIITSIRVTTVMKSYGKSWINNLS